MNPNNSPLVSVIVPMYNTRAYILDTLTSILESTYRPLEVIVVDDGSTDDSLALVQHFAQQHPECKVIAQANLGVSVTRNHAIRIAKGKYILPVDSDDKIGKTFIEHAVERIESDSDIRIVGCRGWKFGAVDEEWRFPDYNRSIMARRNIIPVTSLYRRCDWETVGGYCEQEIYMEDWDFWLSLLELGGRYVRLDEIGIYYRIRPESRWHVAREHKRQTVAALNYRHPEFMHQYWNGPLYHHHIYSKLINLFYRETVRGDFHAWHRGEPIRQDGNRQLRRHQDYFIAEYTISSWWEGWKMTLTRSNPARRAYNCLVQTHQAVAFREVRYLGSVRQSWYVYQLVESQKSKVESQRSKATLIISVYKNVTALAAILESLRRQTEQDIEVIISEDGCCPEMATFIASYQWQWPVQHLTQEDLGWRKERALNQAVLAAKTDWLIFIDGDCVLHPRFIEWHVREQRRGVILAGKRVKLNPALSERMLGGKRLCLLPYLFARRGCRYVEEAFYCGLAKYLRRPVKHLLGSNMSMSRTDLLAINGFDEHYTLPATGEDYDIEWRLQRYGCRIVSLRNLAIQYHLYHKENWLNHDENMVYCEQCQKQNLIICHDGIQKSKVESQKSKAIFDNIQAVVVWRYPGTAEVESLRLFYPHVDRLYIVDNSEGDYHALVSGLDKVTYLPQHQNTGIAKALNIGCEQAVKNGAQWILTMDQDSRWDQQNVIEYIDEVSQYPHIGQVGIFSPMHDIYPPHVKRHAHHTDRFEPRHAVMCSGNLLRATAWLQTGGFREDFFIDLVDDEICCHLHALGWNIIRANHIHLSHQLGEGVHFSPILRHPFFVHEPWRYYHIAQNTRRMITLYPDMAWFYRREIGKHLKHLLLYDRDRKGKKLYQFLRGLILDV